MQKRPPTVKPHGWRAAWIVVGILAAVAAGTACADPGGAPGDEVPRLSIPSPLGTLDYTPGRGVRVGNTRVTLGGYGDVALTRPEGGPATVDLDDLSLFVVWDPTAKVHLFSELEFEHVLTVDDTGRGGTAAWEFLAERLYGDLTVLDPLTVRVGKFLTPVGRWNTIHAQPLVWTTSRPLVTLLPFDPHTTGAMAFGSLAAPNGGVAYSVFGQFTDQLDPGDVPRGMDRGAGLRLEYSSWDDWAVGVTYLAASRFDAGTTRGWQNLVGLDALWHHGPLEVMAEFAHEEGEWGLYVQGVVELVSPFFAVARYEYYDRPAAAVPVNIGVAGLAWKPWSYLICKTEYLFVDHRTEVSPPGFRASVALLF